MNSTLEELKVKKIDFSLKIQLVLLIISIVLMIAMFFYSSVRPYFYMTLCITCLVSAYNRKRIYKKGPLTYLYIIAAFYFMVEAVLGFFS